MYLEPLVDCCGAMSEPFKPVWSRLKLLFEWLEHFDFAWGRMGFGSIFLGKVLSLAAAIIVALAAKANNQPTFVLILSALAALVLTLAASWLALALLDRITIVKDKNNLHGR